MTRLYDPVLGRFLTPDPYVQMLDFTQAFNRYSYCMNSPLCYVDENGEFWWVVAAAVIGGVINVATHWDSIDNVWQERENDLFTWNPVRECRINFYRARHWNDGLSDSDVLSVQ